MLPVGVVDFATFVVALFAEGARLGADPALLPLGSMLVVFPGLILSSWRLDGRSYIHGRQSYGQSWLRWRLDNRSCIHGL